MSTGTRVLVRETLTLWRRRRDDLLAEFAELLVREWDTVPPPERDLWLRRRLGDLLDRRPGTRGRWIG
jgi:hypothetical protein